MIKIGTIGTGWITEEFISCINNNENAKVVCCYSRSKVKAKEFITKLNLKARAFDNFQNMIQEIDAVYIASPNGLHFEQAKYFLSQQKHVIVEKPLTFTFEQALQLYEIAVKNKVILMEAFKLLHCEQYRYLDDFVEKYSPFAANLSLNKYSSRMADAKKGTFNSVFDSLLGKGSTYDMLVYPVELAVSLFGPVRKVSSISSRFLNGVSYANAVILKHENETITTINCSKSAHGMVGSELLSDEGTLKFDDLLKLNNIVLYDVEEQKYYELFGEPKRNLMEYECQVFIKMIMEEDLSLCDYLLKISCETVRILSEVEKN